MKRAVTKPLRARSLDTKALEKAAGGRGTYCGNQLHCTNCGESCDVADWDTMSARCPVCCTEM